MCYEFGYPIIVTAVNTDFAFNWGTNRLGLIHRKCGRKTCNVNTRRKEYELNWG